MVYSSEMCSPCVSADLRDTGTPRGHDGDCRVLRRRYLNDVDMQWAVIFLLPLQLAAPRDFICRIPYKNIIQPRLRYAVTSVAAQSSFPRQHDVPLLFY